MVAASVNKDEMKWSCIVKYTPGFGNDEKFIQIQGMHRYAQGFHIISNT